MPILEIEVVGELAPGKRDGLAGRLAEETGRVLGSRPQGTWVRLRELAREDYAENGGGPPEGVLPVFVRVLMAEVPAGEALARLARDLTTAVAEACGRAPEDVHVLFEPPAHGRIAFGGQLRS